MRLTNVGNDIIVLKKVASGGMAEIFIGKQMGAGTFEKYVAIKRIYPHFADKPKFRKMFLREVELGAHLQHPNIVQVIKCVEQEEELLLVMEYIRGANLSYLINKFMEAGQKVPIPIACHIIFETLKGLDYAHLLQDDATGQGLEIVHRDISPGNILIAFNGAVKLTDFGIGKSVSSTSVTRTGAIKGKFGYLTPETVVGGEHTAQSDIFSLGIVFYEILTASVMFDDENPSNILVKIKNFALPELHEEVPGITNNLIYVLTKMLHPSPSERYQTTAEVIKDLRKVMNVDFPEFSDSDFKDFIQSELSDEISYENQELSTLSSSVDTTEIMAMMSQPIKTTDTQSRSIEVRIQLSSLFLRTVIALLIPIAIFVLAKPDYVKQKYEEIILGKTGSTDVKFYANPDSIPGLLAWFDIDDVSANFRQPIVSWKSRGEINLELVQENSEFAPQYIGHSFNEMGSLHFDGVNDYLATTDIPEKLREIDELTVAIVARASAKLKRGSLFSLHEKVISVDVLRMGLKDKKIEAKYSKAVGSNYAVSKVFRTEDPNIYTVMISPKKFRVYVNGKLMVDEPVFYKYSFADTGSFSLGQEWDKNDDSRNLLKQFVPSDLFRGSMADVLLYDEFLSTKDRQSLEGFLALKYKIPIEQKE